MESLKALGVEFEKARVPHEELWADRESPHFVRRLSSALIGVVISVAILGCDAPNDSYGEAGSHVRPVAWHVAEHPGEHTVKLTMSVSHCVYTMVKPRVKRIEKVERARSTLIKVFVEFRRLPDVPEAAGCADVELSLFKTIRLQRPIGSQILYDGATSPPTIRWP